MLWNLRVASVLPFLIFYFLLYTQETCADFQASRRPSMESGGLSRIRHTSTGSESAVLDFSLTCRARLRCTATEGKSLKASSFSLLCHMVDPPSRVSYGQGRMEVLSGLFVQLPGPGGCTPFANW